MRSMRDDGDADDEAAVDDGGGEHDALTRSDAVEERAVERVERLFVEAGTDQAKREDRELRLGDDLDAVDCAQGIRRELR